MKKILKAKLNFFLLACCLGLLLFFPCYSQNIYEITEAELLELEMNNQKIQEEMNDLKMTLNEAQKELNLLNLSLIETKKSLQKSEREKKIIKIIGITSGIILFSTGIYLGYKIKLE